MRISHLTFLTSISLIPLAIACGDDDDTPKGSGGSSGSGASGGSSGSGASGGTAGSGAGGSGGTAGSGAGGSGGSGGHPSCDLSGAGKPRADVPEPTAGSTVTLTSDTVWDLKGVVNVVEGATLAIEPCTRIEGDKDTLGTLVIQRGGKIQAPGEADAPILFTSALPAGLRSPGDWGGVIILGKAPNFKMSGGNLPSIEGLPPGEGAYGGADEDDDSGVLTYARIEYSGVEIGDGNEINGLTLGSVGRGTTLHHIMVSNTLDDCFEWFGGTVNASHLICNNGGDDMFDIDHGFTGSVQFIFGRQLAPLSSDPNGFECDSDLGGATPVTNGTFTNVTLCGLGHDPANPQYGAVFRENLLGDYSNMILTGFEASFDVRDAAGTPASPNVKLTHTLVKGVVHDVAYDEETPGNDQGFDEREWFALGAGNAVQDTGVVCGAAGSAPMPFPAARIAGGVPLTTSNAGAPTDFDTSADFIGAFEDAQDNWMTGLWIDWAAN